MLGVPSSFSRFLGRVELGLLLLISLHAIMAWIWLKVMRVVAVIDVLLASTLVTVYVYLLSEHLPDLQILQGSKTYYLIIYLYVAACATVQLLVAFKFYQKLTIPEIDNDYVELDDVLPITKLWIIISYVLLFNWALKAGIYAQRCDCGISVALAVYLVEIAFRLCGIGAGSTFMKKVEKEVAVKRAEIKLQRVVSSMKSKKMSPKPSVRIQENDPRV